ncbi:hypothetical protein J6590_012536 [Homalodisca vitripennis]|nr:hypothetical protein J6590_012536 [Homalodisca vitripennis]
MSREGEGVLRAVTPPTTPLTIDSRQTSPTLFVLVWISDNPISRPLNRFVGQGRSGHLPVSARVHRLASKDYYWFVRRFVILTATSTLSQWATCTPPSPSTSLLYEYACYSRLIMDPYLKGLVTAC